MSRSICMAMAFLGMALILTGCGSGPVAIVPVDGRIWYRGHPLNGGTVVFVPDEEKGHLGRMAVADIGPGGAFSLMTDKLPGAEPGWYRVTIATADLPGGMKFPKKYSDSGKSGVSRQIKGGSPNAFDIHLD